MKLVIRDLNLFAFRKITETGRIYFVYDTQQYLLDLNNNTLYTCTLNKYGNTIITEKIATAIIGAHSMLHTYIVAVNAKMHKNWIRNKLAYKHVDICYFVNQMYLNDLCILADDALKDVDDGLAIREIQKTLIELRKQMQELENKAKAVNAIKQKLRTTYGIEVE